MSDWIEQIAGDRVDKYRRAALVLRTLGWLSICWAAMISIWIWMGAKAGSNIWLWSTLGLLVAGMTCLAIAGRIQARASRLVDVPGAAGNDRIRAA